MDRQWSPNFVLAWAQWAGGVTIVLLDLFIHATDDIGHVGIALLVGGKIFHDRELHRRTSGREQAAFHLGHEAGIRSIR